MLGRTNSSFVIHDLPFICSSILQMCVVLCVCVFIKCVNVRLGHVNPFRLEHMKFAYKKIPQPLSTHVMIVKSTHPNPNHYIDNTTSNGFVYPVAKFLLSATIQHFVANIGSDRSKCFNNRQTLFVCVCWLLTVMSIKCCWK